MGFIIGYSVFQLYAMRLLTLQKPFQRKVPKKTVSTKTTLAKFYILLAFLLITIVLLKAVSITI